MRQAGLKSRLYETTRRAIPELFDARTSGAGSARSGIGAATKNRRAIFASTRARLADLATRALSVAIPVFAYICR